MEPLTAAAITIRGKGASGGAAGLIWPHLLACEEGGRRSRGSEIRAAWLGSWARLVWKGGTAVGAHRLAAAAAAAAQLKVSASVQLTLSKQAAAAAASPGALSGGRAARVASGVACRRVGQQPEIDGCAFQANLARIRRPQKDKDQRCPHRHRRSATAPPPRHLGRPVPAWMRLPQPRPSLRGLHRGPAERQVPPQGPAGRLPLGCRPGAGRSAACW